MLEEPGGFVEPAFLVTEAMRIVAAIPSAFAQNGAGLVEIFGRDQQIAVATAA